MHGVGGAGGEVMGNGDQECREGGGGCFLEGNLRSRERRGIEVKAGRGTEAREPRQHEGDIA